MSKKHIFVSFDFDNDRNYKYMLQAWDANPSFDFMFEDRSSGEIQSRDIGRVKAALTSRINSATGTLIIVGSYATSWHKDYLEIGHRNWQYFEIAQSIANRNNLIVVKLSPFNQEPEILNGQRVSRAYRFGETEIANAVTEAYGVLGLLY